MEPQAHCETFLAKGEMGIYSSEDKPIAHMLYMHYVF